jgi:TRAP-type mannitol/chloroaromatic compound transport system permease small subunit
MIKKITRIIDQVNEWIGKFIGLWVLLLIGIIVYEVVMRRVFNSPTIWVHELSLYVFGTMWVLGGGYTLRHRAMVNMDMLYNRFSPKKKAVIDIITVVIALTYCSVLLWKSGTSALNSIKWLETSKTIWDVPLYPIRAIIPIGAVLLIIQIISNLLKDILILTGMKEIER